MMTMMNNNDRMKIEILDTTEYTNWTLEEWMSSYTQAEITEMLKRYMDYARANKKYRQGQQETVKALKTMAKDKGMKLEDLMNLLK